RERRAGIGDRVDVEEGGARNVRLRELGARVTLELRHVPGAVDHPYVAPAQVGGEPVGRDERRGHWCSSARGHGAARRGIVSSRRSVLMSFRMTSVKRYDVV